jgi:uncharacterized integral membrane protein
MLRKIKRTLFNFTFITILFLSFPKTSFADGEPPATISDLEKVFSTLVGNITTLLALFSFIMVIVGGFKYVTSQGDPKAVSSARNTITWAILGLVFIIISWLILVFIGKFTGVNVTNFCIGTACAITNP